jgi:hypothetical protein
MDADTDLSKPSLRRTFRFLDVLKGFRSSLRRHLDGVETAHAQRRALEAIPAEAEQDTGLSRSDLTGIPEWQPDLPFFMQSGFGKRH